MNDHLLEKIASPENLLSAWRGVRGNIPRYRRARAHGPDGVSLAEFEQDLDAQLRTLQDMLLNNRYEPTPPARFNLPKADGSVRQISVLNVRDRVAQRAAQQILEPLFEPGFLPCSFGFRPGLSVEDAVECAQVLRNQGNGWLVDGDIAACFDSLDHDLLIHLVRRQVKDGRVLRLLQAWLDGGVLAAGMPGTASDEAPSFNEKAARWIKEGMDFTLGLAGDQEVVADYMDYEHRVDSHAASNPDKAFLDVDEYYRRKTMRRLLANGLALGAGWAAPRLAEWGRTSGRAALSQFNTPAGRRTLKSGAAVTAGLAGVAAAAAVTSFLMKRRAGPAPSGILQGSPLSPLLANIYLSPFDRELVRRGFGLVRFADDWVVCCPGQKEAEQAYNSAIAVLAKVRLKIHPEKTHIRQPSEPVEWLGMTIRPVLGGGV